MSAADTLRPRLATAGRPIQVAGVLMLLLAVPVVGAAEADALGPPIGRNAAYTEKFDRAYEPFESNGPTDALVFLPPAYGEWRNHPFQWLRNDPGFDGPTVYAISRTPPADFAVIEAYPDRTYYRFRYHGEWTPAATAHVFPVLERLRVVEGPEITGRTTVTIPDRIVAVSVAVSTDRAVRRYDYRGALPAELVVDWTVTDHGVTVGSPNLEPAEEDIGPLPIEAPTELVLTITITEPSGATLTYREAVLVRPTSAGVEVLWPPASSVCTLVTDCGLEGTYLPDRPSTRPAGIVMNTSLVEAGG